MLKRALILLMVSASVATADEPKPRAPQPPTASELAKLYVEVGRELMIVTRADSRLTVDLWPRYRWIHLHRAMSSPVKRLEAQDVLDRLRADLIVARARGTPDAS